MTVDIRAIVTCSLGELISASVSDDYIQGSGLIKTKGNCEISGLISPAVGSIVTFTYTKSGIVRNVPRKLRVLSSFADPYRRTTKVELGCKLTYLQDLKDPIKWTALDDPDNAGITEADTDIVTFPISAASVAGQCLSALSISSTGIPLTNRFSIAEFDFGGGYVSTLSDLLVSESYVGYLTFEERLKIISLASPGEAGPVLSDTFLIDLGPIGVGDLAGDAVTVSYSTLKLNSPDNTEVDTDPEPEVDAAGNEIGWAQSTTRNTSEVVISYTTQDGQQKTAVYAASEFTQETSDYREITTRQEDGSTGRANVVRRRTLEIKKTSAAVAGGIVSEYLSNGFGFGNFDTRAFTVDDFQYDGRGRQTFSSSRTTGDAILAAGGLSVPWVVDGLPVAIPGGTVQLERSTVSTSYIGRFKQQVTRRFGPWIRTIAGQQAVAEGRASFLTRAQVEDFIGLAISGSYLIDVTIVNEFDNGSSGQVPAAAEVINDEYGFTVGQVSEIELVTGSPAATRRIEFSMPYAPDDTFFKFGEKYFSRASDAPARANLFGRTQNRLLFGNRNGMNIQTVPEGLPTEPFGAFYLSANGSVTQYRTNGTSWTMDSNGIVASTDALYWGVAGKSA
jgi:hypothetical protein